MKTFSEKIRYLREDADMTQKEVGQKIGVSDRMVGYYESGEVFPKDENVLKNIANLFNVSIDYLLGLVDSPNMYVSTNFDKNNLPREAVKELRQFEEFLRTKYK